MYLTEIICKNVICFTVRCTRSVGPLDTMLRSLVLKQYCHYGNKEAIAEAQSRFAAHVNKTAPLPADLKDLVYSTCMCHGDDTTFDQLVKVINGCGLVLL